MLNIYININIYRYDINFTALVRQFTQKSKHIVLFNAKSRAYVLMSKSSVAAFPYIFILHKTNITLHEITSDFNKTICS